MGHTDNTRHSLAEVSGAASLLSNLALKSLLILKKEKRWSIAGAYEQTPTHLDLYAVPFEGDLHFIGDKNRQFPNAALLGYNLASRDSLFGLR